mmetsp:Transcript_15606/g.30460  ORF Transcript_15606/g.30460 Transcript_15606/m.30460 type:complete len:90 (+) Transcript_15606:640-909(+)
MPAAAAASVTYWITLYGILSDMHEHRSGDNFGAESTYIGFDCREPVCGGSDFFRQGAKLSCAERGSGTDEAQHVTITRRGPTNAERGLP